MNNVIKKVEFSKNKNQNETEEKEDGKEKIGEEEGKKENDYDLKVVKQHHEAIFKSEFGQIVGLHFV